MFKVFTGYFAAQIDAERACQAAGGALTGLQNQDEALYIQCKSWKNLTNFKFLSASLLSQIKQPSASVWIGIKRKASCVGKPQDATCTRTQSFEWTDDSADGVNGMVFQKGQPDNGGKALNQDCALLLASRTPTIKAGGTYYAAQMEDVNCIATFNAANAARKTGGYACGQQPKTCQPGWKFFDRPTGGWCMKVSILERLVS